MVGPTSVPSRTCRAFLLVAACVLAAPVIGARAAQAPASPQTSAPNAPPPLATLDVQEANQPTASVFQRDDVIRMLVWGFPELTHVATIQEDGTATFPLVDEVMAAGRTAAQIRDEIVARLTKVADDGPRRLRREDVLTITVWGQPDLTHTAEIGVDGSLTVPLVGTIQAEGRTIEQVKAAITAQMGEYFREPRVSILPAKLVKDTVLNPRVSILPERLRQRQVAVIGQVARPGLYPIQGRLRVLEALAMAQYLDSSELNSIVVIRDYDGRPQYTGLRLRDFINKKNDDQNIYLNADDIVIVPKSTIARIQTFVADWFTGTRGIFDWWIALQQAKYADEYGKAVERLNNSIFLIGQ